MLNKPQTEIMKEWIGDIDNPIVSVLCLSYNYEKYIEIALNSFLMQKTNFPFEIIVHDDASTDNTVNIIKEYQYNYPQIIKPIFEIENQYKKGGLNVIYKLSNKYIKGKYLAICDGDDYWLDDNKLQEQYLILKANPKYGVCYSKVLLNQDEVTLYPNINQFGSQTLGFDDLLIANKIPNCTTLIRFDLHLKYYDDIKPEQQGWFSAIDYAEWLYLSTITMFKFVDKKYAAYRCLSNSISHSALIENEIKYIRGVEKIREFFRKRFKSETKFSSTVQHEVVYNFAINRAAYRLKCLNSEYYYNSLGNLVLSDKDKDYRLNLAFRILKESGCKMILKKIFNILKHKLFKSK